MKYILLFTSFLFFSYQVFSGNTDLLFSPKGVAEVHITLPDAMSIDYIEKDVDTRAFMEIKNSATSSYSENELYTGYILIEGRGNTTWEAPKKPFNVDLIFEDGEDNSFPVLGMPSHHKWCLLTFYFDKSLMRIPLAFYLGRKMEYLSYTPRLHYVELYVNEEYRGLYSFCEKIERNENRIDIKKLTVDERDQEEPRISGGYIIEINAPDRIKQDEKYFTSELMDINFTFKYPKNKNVTGQQINWIKNYIDEFETVLYGDNFKDEQNGFRKYIDENSFIDWYILQELAKNNDANMFLSVFLHKDRNGKLFMSAPWDFDIAFGNIDYSDAAYEDQFWIAYSAWFERLFEDENFSKKVQERFDELIPLFDKIPSIVNANKEHLETQGVVSRNFQRWPVLGTYLWPNFPPFPETHAGEVQRLYEWAESRKVWMYINLPVNEEEKQARIKSTKPVIRVLEPEKLLRGETTMVTTMRGYSYIWTLDDKEFVTDGEIYYVAEKGDHYLQIKDYTGEESLKSYPVTIENEAQYKIIESPFILYPNPVVNSMFINCSALNYEDFSLELYDLKGILLKGYSYKKVSISPLIQVELSDIEDGIYIVNLRTSSGDKFSHKIIVSH